MRTETVEFKDKAYMSSFSFTRSDNNQDAICEAYTPVGLYLTRLNKIQLKLLIKQLQEIEKGMSDENQNS